jgi:hypothetical protein
VTVAATEMRKPFTLRIQIDAEHYYEEEFDREIPYVHDNDVYLFSGDSFGLKVAITNGVISTVTFQKSPADADVEVKFSQDTESGASPMMLLVIRSHIKQTLYLDALMTIPDKKGVYRTNILPIQPGLTGYESWPHPIVQLVLTHLRLSKEPPNQRMVPTD